MTTVDQAREAVHQRWVAQWGTTTGYVFEAETEKTFDKGTAPWARVTVRQVSGGQACLAPKGERLYLRYALVMIQIFTPLNNGMKLGSTLAQQARELYEGEEFSGLDFTNGQVREVGPDGRWYMHAVDVEFSYDETK